MLKLKSFGVTAVLAVALAAPATSAAQGQDLRNPDRQFPAAPEQTQDLRNADNRIAAPASSLAGTVSTAETRQDLRNADQRAPGTGEIEVVPVEVPATTTIELPAEGFDWGDAGIGAAGGIAVLAMLAGLAAAVAHRRRDTRVIA